MSKRKLMGVVRALLVLAAMTTEVASAQSAADPDDAGPVAEEYLQVWVGALDTDEDWDLNDPADGSELSGDIGTLPYFGGGAQRLYGRRFQAGYEGGGLVTFKNESAKFYGNNGRLRIEIDNTLFSTEFYMGGVLSARIASWLRIYAGGGPTVAYGYLSDDNDDDPPADEISAASSNVDISSGSHSLSITLYGRAGFEFETPSGFTFGGHARYAPHEFDFDDGGKLKLDSVAYFVSLGQRL